MTKRSNKKWILILIIIFPSFFWLILETSTINSKKLPHYGPKKIIAAGDTTFFKVSDNFSPVSDSGITETLSPDELHKIPLYAAIFVHENYRVDAYRLTGLSEYLQYKQEKISHIPFVFFTAAKGGNAPTYEELKKIDEHNNIHFAVLDEKEHQKLRISYFTEKPYYIDYSFFVLIDRERNIRGYYDARYVSEIKRLIEEYQHLRLKEEKKLLIEENEIEKKS